MIGFIKYLYVLIHKKEIIKESKPYFVFLYVTFNGDQVAIKNAMNDHYGINNIENRNRVLEGINLDDYIMAIEKGFDKYKTSDKDLVLYKDNKKELINKLKNKGAKE